LEDELNLIEQDLPNPEKKDSENGKETGKTTIPCNFNEAQGFQPVVKGGTNYVDEIHIYNSAYDNASKSSSFDLLQSTQQMNIKLSTPKVFISYSHNLQSPTYKDQILALADRLIEDGIDCNIDQYEESPQLGWHRWMLNEIENADFVLIACSEEYDRRFRGNEVQGKGKGGTWEGGIIIQELYDAQGQNSKFIPIILNPKDSVYIPSPLSSETNYRLQNDDGYELLYRRLTNQPKIIKPQPGKLQKLARRDRKQTFPGVLSSISEEIIKPEIYRSSEASIDFVAYDDKLWVGREKLVEQFIDQINSSCRVLLLVGMTGIGKTALAEKIVEGLRGDWIEHRDNFETEDKVSDFASVALQWLERWGQNIPIESRKSEQLMPRLINHLCENHYLILMDSLEYLLKGNEDDGWGDFHDEWWGKFFVSFFAASNCQSRLILTSQDLPTKFESADCDRYHQLWSKQLLKGLDESEQIKLFKKSKLDVDLNLSDSPLRIIGQVYDGHPLVLRTIAGEINCSYNGQVAVYWKENGHYIEKVKKDLEEAYNQGKDHKEEDGWQLVSYEKDRWEIASYTKSLRDKVKARIEETFKRLSRDVPDSYLLLCMASIYRCEVKESWWLVHLADENYSEKRQKIAMTILRERYLVEDRGNDSEYNRLVAQHTLIRSIAISHRLMLPENENAQIDSM
jgi:uncharacterized protein YwgA